MSKRYLAEMDQLIEDCNQEDFGSNWACLVLASDFDTAVAALREYGRHHSDCKAWNDEPHPCTCGFSAALDALGEKWGSQPEKKGAE